MTRIKALAIFNALSFIIHLLFTYLIQAKIINNKNVSEISAEYESLFTPEGITFSIWGIIYTLLGLFCLYHIRIAYKHDRTHAGNGELSKIGLWFIIINLASAGWLVAWVNGYLSLSVLLIIIQLVGLIAIHIRLNIYRPDKTAGVKLCTQFPLSVYLGWISIATIANISSYLVASNWNALNISPINWTIIMMNIATLLSLLIIFLKKNIYFGLVVAWGLYGIMLKRKSADEELYSNIIMTAWICIALIVMAAAVQLARNISYRKPREIFPESRFPIK